MHKNNTVVADEMVTVTLTTTTTEQLTAPGPVAPIALQQERKLGSSSSSVGKRTVRQSDLIAGWCCCAKSNSVKMAVFRLDEQGPIMQCFDKVVNIPTCALDEVG